MKRLQGITPRLMQCSLLCFTMASYAAIPLWTITPLTATTISIPENGIVTVQYQVTNQSNRPHTLVMTGITGVTQVTSGSGVCANPFSLPGHGSCTLTLQINGNQIASGNTSAPVLCEQANPLQCYRPAADSTLMVTVTENQYTLGGTIAGLSGTVYLQNNGVSPQAFSENGSFTVATGLTDGTAYEVTVQSQPTDQTCSVDNGSGTVNGANVTNITVTCADNGYTVGGTVSGLLGTVVLLNNGGDADTVTSNGSFTFSTPIAEGGAYNVTVGTQPTVQTCIVTNGSGTMGGSNVTNVNVACTTNTTTLSTSVSNLALGVNGKARTITVTNTGGNIAGDLSIDYPEWPFDTTAESDCGTSLETLGTCTITVTPGPIATSSCNLTNTSPTPGVVTVSASNVLSSATTGVEVLTFGCIYQEGFVFAIDDSTSSTVSIGGTTASLTDISSGIQWYNGSFEATNAQSLTDGATNTQTIINVQGDGNYAATTCTSYQIDSSGNTPCSTGTCYEGWYLPAICQLGSAGGGDADCVPGTPNLESNLRRLIAGCSGSKCLSGFYWSSTEYPPQAALNAWYEYYDPSVSLQGFGHKDNTFLAVRCVRELTP